MPIYSTHTVLHPPWAPPKMGTMTDAELVAWMRATKAQVEELLKKKYEAPKPPPVKSKGKKLKGTGVGSYAGLYRARKQYKERTDPMKPITRVRARELGFRTYFTGVPCKFGHNAPKFVNNSTCVVCSKRYVKAYQTKVA